MQGFDDWQLPGAPHLPGQTPRPSDDDALHRIARSALRPTDPASWQENAAWLAGLRLYEHRYYWEAHEVWEAVWMNAAPKSRERALVQGVIQLANAALKQVMGRPRASRRLAAMAERHVRDAASPTVAAVMGLATTPLLGELGRYRAALDATPLAHPPRLITIEPAAPRT
ncbi:hypothetical protein BH23PSE1_BH23PSE1_02710 [soil metagenome]